MNLHAVFESLCEQAVDPNVRAAEEDLAQVVSALAAGWLPDPGTLSEAGLRRAGHLMELTAMLGVDDAERKNALLRALPNRPSCDGGDSAITFWTLDSAGGHDSLAKRWGLARGLNLERFRQILIQGVC